MSWIEKLAETYDVNAGAEGLCPLYHTTMTAHLIVTIDEKGNFVNNVKVIEKQNKDREIEKQDKDREVVIPCTEDSSSRTSSITPHPLFDSLQYVAGDLADNFAEEQFKAEDAAKNRKNFQDCFTAYMKNLDQWCDSEFANPYICAVRDYLKRRTLCRDLIRAKILPVNADNKIYLEKPSDDTAAANSAIYKSVTGQLSKALVLFRIFRGNAPAVDLWKNSAVQDSWKNYYTWVAATEGLTGFCQVTGKEAPLAKLHPKRIRNAGDQSKIISGNDKENFTYRGRFDDPMEACSISMEVSQKAHSALRWLLNKQGTHEDSLYMVAWAVSSHPEVPDPTRNTADLEDEDEDEDEGEARTYPETAETSAKKLDALIKGYWRKRQNSQDQLNLPTKGLCFIMLDAASPGTLAVKTYRELDETRYLKNIMEWHTKCAWLQKYGKDKKFYGAPAPRDIVFAAYGNMKPDDPRLKSTVSRLLPCIIDDLPIPLDIVNSVIRRASRYESVEPWEFNKNLGIACAVYRHSEYKRKKRSLDMPLDKNLKSRDYLYGRLLAAAEYLETSALTQNEISRPTNAMRMMSHFSEHPYSTWRNLNNALNPYRERLKANNSGSLIRAENVLQEVHSAFELADFEKDTPLSGEYLLGYYCQRADFWTKKETKNENE